MNEITKEIFEYLNVQPNEVFRIKNSENYYTINKDLELYFVHSQKDLAKKLWKLCGPYRTISNLIVGKATIEKIICPNEKEQLAIDYAKACGYNWLAKDENGDIYAFLKKPEKHISTWVREYNNEMLSIEIPISFLSWNDTEPYYIGDGEEEKALE